MITRFEQYVTNEYYTGPGKAIGFNYGEPGTLFQTSFVIPYDRDVENITTEFMDNHGVDIEEIASYPTREDGYIEVQFKFKSYNNQEAMSIIEELSGFYNDNGITIEPRTVRLQPVTDVNKQRSRPYRGNNIGFKK